MSEVQTKFHKRNPWSGEMMPAKIASDPIKKRRAGHETTYNATFSKMQFGDCVVCNPDDVNKWRKAMISWIEWAGINAKCVTTKRYPSDNMGRVWMVQK